MFRRRKEEPDLNDLFSNPLFVNQGLVEGIRAALERPDLTDEDRRELEAALKNLDAGDV